MNYIFVQIKYLKIGKIRRYVLVLEFKTGMQFMG